MQPKITSDYIEYCDIPKTSVVHDLKEPMASKQLFRDGIKNSLTGAGYAAVAKAWLEESATFEKDSDLLALASYFVMIELVDRKDVFPDGRNYWDLYRFYDQ